MKEEVVIINGDLESVYANGKDLREGFTKHVMELWNAHTVIRREPQFAVIHVKGTDSFRVVIDIDIEKSNFAKGLIAPERVIPVDIPIRFGKDKLEKIRYTTFRRIITHETSDHF